MKRSIELRRMFVVMMAAMGLVGAMMALAVSPSAAEHVDPIIVGGNPVCGDFAPEGVEWIELKIDPVPSGISAHNDGTLFVTIDVYETAAGQVFDWESNIGVVAVFAKGGPQGGNLYNYDPPETSDTGLHAPVTPGGQYANLSHISFCYEPTLEVSKTAETTFTRTFEWEIEKTVSPAIWDLFDGDSGTSDYTVAVTKTGFTDGDFAVSGNITIHNPWPNAAVIASVSDSVNGTDADVDCGVTFPYTLAAGETLICSYSADLENGDDSVNTATVETTDDSPVGGGIATAEVIFDEPTDVVNDTINVTDSVEGDLGSFSDSDSVSYTRTFECNGDEGSHDNTATIVETGQTDDASVTVNCYALTVEKDATTSHDRTLTYDWTIEKVVDQPALELEINQSHIVNYDVTVNAVLFSEVDSNFAVGGNITVSNPNPTRNADLTGVTDVVSLDIAATVNCPSLTVPAGGSLDCTYSAALPDATDRVNTATATQQNYDYDSAGIGTVSGTTDYSGSANVIFGDPTTTTTVDECADVSDTLGGVLGSLCFDAAPFTFEYPLTIGPYDECGEFTVDNTATVVAQDTGATDSDSASVIVTVPCAFFEGCTPGFWANNLRQWGGSAWPVVDPDSAFELNTDITWRDAINARGQNVITAHAAAALLNLYSGMSYSLTHAQIVEYYNAGNTSALAAANEAGCPFDQHHQA